MENHDSILFRHVVDTLPDDIHARRRLLNALISRLSPGSERMHAHKLIAGIDQHILTIRELPLSSESNGGAL